MKHIFKRAFALTMAASLFAVSAFAAPTFSQAKYDDTTGILDVKVAGYEEGKDATILVLKDGVTPAAATNNDIIFIDQITLTDKTVAEYTAPIKVRATAVGATGVNVYVGGDDITSAIPYVKDGESGASVIEIKPAAEEPTYAVVFNKTATYKTLAEAKAAVKVTKILSGTTTELAAGEFTVTETATATNVYTFVVKVGETVVETITGVTITPDTPSTGKTGIKGVVKYTKTSGNDIMPYALVLVTKQGDKNVVAATVTDINGEFAVEGLAAGSYRVIVRGATLSNKSMTSYLNKSLSDVAVTEGNMTVAVSDTDCILLGRMIAGDVNEDGKVDIEDYSKLVQNFGRSN